MSDAPWTFGRLLEWTTGYLQEKGAEFPRLDAEVLLAHAANCARIQLYTRFNDEAPEAIRNSYKQLVRQRVDGCPVAYLVGRKEFFSLEFAVDGHVLIPRPDTEVLVMEVLRLAKPQAAPRLVDVGTGSGAIAVACLKNHPGMTAIAVDRSKEALALARRNAERHQVDQRMQFVPSDLMAEVPAGQRFDFIVSNPPYIPTGEIRHLPVGVRDFEPHLALDGGPTGYEVTIRLIDQARWRLAPGGWLLLETGAQQAEKVVEALRRHPEYGGPAVIQDYAGHPRVVRVGLAAS